MAIGLNDVAGEWVYHMILFVNGEFLGHNCVPGLCTLKPKNLTTCF